MVVIAARLRGIAGSHRNAASQAFVDRDADNIYFLTEGGSRGGDEVIRFVPGGVSTIHCKVAGVEVQPIYVARWVHLQEASEVGQIDTPPEVEIAAFVVIIPPRIQVKVAYRTGGNDRSGGVKARDI